MSERRPRTRALRVAALGALLSSVLLATPARANPPASLWRPEFRKVQTFEYALTLGLGASALAISLSTQPRVGPRGPILFDAVVRDLARLSDMSARQTTANIGDVGYYGMLVLPTVDVAVTWAIHKDSALAWQMFAMNMGALAWAGSIAIAIEYAIGRQRPNAAACADQGYPPEGCGKLDNYRSFISGHVATAAAGAGVTCAHHVSMPLYGGIGDVVACAAGVSLTLMTGTARLMSDRHWATDVVAGLAAGALAGYVWPMLYHYRPQPSAAEAAPALVWWAVPQIGPAQLGGRVFGFF